MIWHSSIDKLVAQLARGVPLTECEQAYLSAYLPLDLLEIDEASIYQLLPKIFKELRIFLDQFTIQLNLEYLWRCYLPLASFLLKQNPPFFLGVVGMQGTGKTTLALVLKQMLELAGKQVLHFSLDDLYKTYADRQALQQQDPRLRWRGVPGTHDVQLGIDVLSAIRKGDYLINVPRFDKSLHQGAGDRLAPEIITQPIDIVLFEGWFVGAQCLANLPPNSSEFMRDSNQRLREYQPLWQFLDYLVALIPSDYRCSMQWRQEAEIRQIQQGKAGMSPIEIQEFVSYFWQALPPEIYLPDIANRANLVVKLSSDRQILDITTGFLGN